MGNGRTLTKHEQRLNKLESIVDILEERIKGLGFALNEYIDEVRARKERSPA